MGNYLNASLAKKAGRSIGKGEITYESTQLEDGNWLATVISPILDKEYEAVDADRRVAEQTAAKVAMETEFPDLLREKASKPAAIGASPNAGQQRPPPVERQQQQQDSKNKLSIYAQVLQDKNLVKGDIVY